MKIKQWTDEEYTLLIAEICKLRVQDLEGTFLQLIENAQVSVLATDRMKYIKSKTQPEYKKLKDLVWAVLNKQTLLEQKEKEETVEEIKLQELKNQEISLSNENLRLENELVAKIDPIDLQALLLLPKAFVELQGEFQRLQGDLIGTLEGKSKTCKTALATPLHQPPVKK